MAGEGKHPSPGTFGLTSLRGLSATSEDALVAAGPRARRRMLPLPDYISHRSHFVRPGLHASHVKSDMAGEEGTPRPYKAVGRTQCDQIDTRLM